MGSCAAPGLGHAAVAFLPKLYAYLPYLNDSPDSEFEFLLLDANTYLGESIVGTRLGRLQLPYGFYNMQRLNPADRLGIHHAQPMQIYWGQNSAIFDRGDGWMTYFLHTPRSSSFQAQFELGRIVRDYPEPQEDYLTVLSELGMELDRQENQFASVELEFLGDDQDSEGSPRTRSFYSNSLLLLSEKFNASFSNNFGTISVGSSKIL